MLGHQAQVMFSKNPTIAYYPTHLIPTVKHGAGGVTNWTCFAATGPRELAVIEIKMTSILYQNILETNLRPFVQQLKMGQNWVMQQGSGPKHTSKSTSECPRKNKMEWNGHIHNSQESTIFREVCHPFSSQSQ